MEAATKPMRGRAGAARRACPPLLIALALLLLCSPVLAQSSELLVDATWLGERLGDPAIRIVDIGPDPQDYARAHIPGAVYAGLGDIRFRVAAGGYRLPTEEELAPILSRLGIGPDTHVVVYDEGSSLNAARLFFTLDVFGHPRVSILDGGIAAWKRAGLPLSGEPVTPARTTYRPPLRPERVASSEEIVQILGDSTVAIVDARSPVEYAGTAQMGKRGGHIPGAVLIEWRQHLRPDMTFKSVGELRALYEGHGVSRDKQVVTYCQAQHRGAQAYFVLRLLGYDRVSGYDRSWAEWGNRDELPVER